MKFNAMDICRDYYLNQLIKLKNDGMVKVITGVRRCGKSFLLFRLFRQYLLDTGISADQMIEIQLDQLINEPLRDPRLLAKTIRNRVTDKKQYYVFIDEIQMCHKVLREGLDLSRIAPEDRESAYITFYDALNEFRSMDNVDLYVTGSNSKTLSSDIATAFRDRGETVQVHPLSFGELSSFRKETGFSLLKEYMTYGGMPLAVLKEDMEAKRKYLRELFEKVYLKDIIERHRLQNEMVLEKVTDLLCSSIGFFTNPSKLVNALDSLMKIKSNVHTLKKYLDILEDSFLFRKADRYDIKGKHYLEYPSKYYAEDVGLRNARLNFRQFEHTHLMENILYNELIRRGCSIDVGVVPQETRKNGRHEIKQLEIDFIVNSDKGKVYLQSAFAIDDEEKKQQEIMPFRLCNDFFSRIVVTGADDTLWTDADGITYVGIIPFLLDESILSDKMK